MSWFKRKDRLESEHNDAAKASAIEIVAHREATKSQIEDVKKANDALNGIFAKNHFTLTIYVAAGGNPEQLTTKVAGETPKEWERKK